MPRIPHLTLGTLCTLLLTLSSCKEASTTSSQNQQLQQLIQELSLDGDPIDGRLIPEITEPMSQLGRDLFFTKGLGGNQTAACASCHHPVLGGGDALALPIGVDALDPELCGEGRVHDPSAEHYDGGPTVPRNSPTTFNLALWSETLFWDGRVQEVAGGIATPDSATATTPDPLAGSNLSEAQARFPVTSPEEMRGFTFEPGESNTTVRDHLAGRLGNFGAGAGELSEDWLGQFRLVFNDPIAPADEVITFERVVEAIAAYENSQVFVDTPWSDYVQGDATALSESARRGALLFFQEAGQGGFSCFKCHGGDFFTDEKFYVVGFPQIGRGKGDVNHLGGATADFGRERVTGDAKDRFAFRTPSLINVAVTAPYGHAGSFLTLEETMRYHLDPFAGFATYTGAGVQPGMQLDDLLVNTQEVLDVLQAQQAQGNSLLPANLAFSEKNITDLVAFLHALTDPRVLSPAAMEPWIPRSGGIFEDSQRLDGYTATSTDL